MSVKEFTINGNCAFATYGVRMGNGFVDALCVSPELKPFIENESRLEDGKRVIINNIRKKDREVTLTFTIEAPYNKNLSIMRNDFRVNRANFIAELEKGAIDINIPTRSREVYHLIYTGKGVKYNYSRNFTFCSFVAKFIEPNPANRD